MVNLSQELECEVKIKRDNSDEVVNLVQTQDIKENIKTEKRDSQLDGVNKVVETNRTSTRNKKTPVLGGSDFLW
jgi:hypothetical protein